MEIPTEKTVFIMPADPNMSLGGTSAYRQKKVAAYCRVSTDEDEQLLSYEAQCRYYRDKIGMNKEWKLAGIFADEGITGTSTKKRDEFNRMIRLCEKGKIDIILTKSISRFARNTVDTLSYVRKLRAMDIAVIFEKEAIDTSKMTDEMLLTTMSMFAQAESESISKNVSGGIRYRYREGKVSYKYPIFGYTPGPNKIPVINEEQAMYVRNIFEMYLAGKTLAEIKEHLENHHVLTANGKEEWSRTIVLAILKNEKYSGDAILQKTFVKDVISHKIVVNNGQLPKYIVRNAHPAIIDRAVYNAVQEEFARRNTKRKVTTDEVEHKGRYSKYALSELLICEECGTNYRRVIWTRAGGKKAVWRCVNRIENATKYCKQSPSVEESLIHAAILRIINRCIHEDDGLRMLHQVLTRVYSNGRSPSDMYAAEAKIKELKAMMREMIELAVKDGADSERYDKQFATINKQIKEYTEIFENEKRIVEASSTQHEVVDELYDTISEKGYQFHEFDDALVRKFFECIKVTPERTIKAFFRGGKMVREEPLDPQ